MASTWRELSSLVNAFAQREGMTSRRDFLLCLGGLATLAATPAYGQVWRKVCLADTLLSDCPVYTPPVTGRGYFGGGGAAFGAPAYNEIDGLDFVTETAINPAATLATSRLGAGGVNSAVRGYFGGGAANTFVGTPSLIEIDGLVFASEAAINPAATLATARLYMATANSSSRGYFAGGGTGNISIVFVLRNEIDGIRFDTEAAINPAAALVTARYNMPGVQSVARGYFVAGGITPVTGVMYTEIDGIDFATEAAINPAATLNLEMGASGINSSTRGYFPKSTLNPVHGLDFATETTFATAANLSEYSAASVNSSARGYCAGGLVPVFPSAQIAGLAFASETAFALGASLAVARSWAAGVQSGAP